MPLKKRSLRSQMQDANRAALDVPAPVPTPEVDLHDPNPSTGEVFQYGAKKDPAADLVNFEWPGHAPQGSADDTPTQVFSDQEIETGKLAQPVRRRLTDAEAQAQLRKAERGYGKGPKPELTDAPPSLRQAAGDAFANAKSVEQLAQEDAARVLGRTPQAPPVTGELADAPIVTTVDRRGSNLGRVAGERRAGSGNMVTATPSNADIGEAVIKEYPDAYANDVGSEEGLLDPNHMRAVARATRDMNTRNPLPPANQSLGEMARSNSRNVEASMLGDMKSSEATPFDTGRLAADYARDTYSPKKQGTPYIKDERPSSATAVTTPPPVDNVVGTAGKPGRFNLVGQFRKGAEGGAPGSALEATGGAIGKTLGEVAGAYRAGQYGAAAATAAGAGVDAALAPLKYAFSPAISATRGILARNATTAKALEAVEGSPFLKRMAQKSWIRGGQAIGNTAEAVGMGGFGTALKLGRIGTEMAAYGYIGRKGAESTAARQNVAPAFREALADQQRNARNAGMDVSSVRSNSSDTMLQLKALVGADPKIEYKENPSLKAQVQAEQRKRIRHLIAIGAVHPIATGRPTIKGGGDE